MTDRDPIDPQAMAQAVSAWADIARGDPTSDECDEADIALEGVMLAQGVISPDDVIEHFAVLTDCAADQVFAVLTDGTEIRLAS